MEARHLQGACLGRGCLRPALQGQLCPQPEPPDPHSAYSPAPPRRPQVTEAAPEVLGPCSPFLQPRAGPAPLHPTIPPPPRLLWPGLGPQTRAAGCHAQGLCTCRGASRKPAGELRPWRLQLSWLWPPAASCFPSSPGRQAVPAASRKCVCYLFLETPSD